MFDGVTRLLSVACDKSRGAVISGRFHGNSSSCSTMVDIDVKHGAAWVCQTQGCKLPDILLPVHLNNRDDEEDLSQSHKETDQVAPVVLEQVEEGSPCILTLSCSPSFPTAISSLMVISEARTIEVYNQLEEYCGTVRGTKDESIQSDSPDRGPFYRKQLALEYPSSTCEVKVRCEPEEKSRIQELSHLNSVWFDLLWICFLSVALFGW
ncbi:hypothetical protein CHARACLAT_003426 [Characodon lateralis]|uniref:Uncharacterized protein n=1 Tax=Characodon lateralis TaxID=208331 RepID=A0ABU7E7B2_9TELE|nr:hypothetical protein [Characodon lateralis]